MNDRIRKLRRDLNLTQQEFADRLNIKRNTVATYETGKSNPSDAAVNLICREFNVSEPWLRTGEGEMFVARPREDELADFVSGLLRSRPDDIRRRFVIAISKLNTQELEILERAALHLAEYANTPAEHIEDNPKSQTVEEVEAEYIKTMSELARKRERTALNSTDADTTEKIS